MITCTLTTHTADTLNTTWGIYVQMLQFVHLIVSFAISIVLTVMCRGFYTSHIFARLQSRLWELLTMAIELKSSFLFPKGKGTEFIFVSEESNIDFENKWNIDKKFLWIVQLSIEIMWGLLRSKYRTKYSKGKIKTRVRQPSKAFSINSSHEL